MDCAPKNNKGKPLVHLLPMDVLIKWVLPAYMEGLELYYRESWRKGFPISVMYDACMRHLSEFFFEGKDLDDDAAKLGIIKHHLAGCMFSLLTMLWTLETKPELDDRPCKLKKNQ